MQGHSPRSIAVFRVIDPAPDTAVPPWRKPSMSCLKEWLRPPNPTPLVGQPDVRKCR